MWPLKLDGEETIMQFCLAHFHAFGKGKGPFELTRGDPMVKVILGAVFVPGAPDEQFTVFDRDIKLIAREARNRKRNAQHFGATVVFRQELDVVRRIAALGSCRGVHALAIQA